MEYSDKLIEHWQTIIACVFSAEHNLPTEIVERLERKDITADEYTKAVALEILSKSDPLSIKMAEQELAQADED